MSNAEHPDELTTRVGRVSPTELSFCGHDVGDLMEHNYWQLMSLSVGGPELDAAACRLLDRLTTCMLACDPRIWPLKVVQLAACEGRVSSGLGVGVMAMETSPLSHWTAGAAARWLSEQQARLLAGEEMAQLGLGEGPPPGFGVTGRDTDQRVVLFSRWRETSRTDRGAHERLLASLEPAVKERCGQALRVDGLAAAVLLDLGFSVEHISVVAGILLGFPNILANAYEGAHRGPALRELPSARVRYVGHAPRRSRRAWAHDATR